MATSLLHRDPSDPARRAVELAQRGRMILDVATADLEAAEQALGPSHPTAWHFRQALAEARRSWDRLRAEFGGAALEAALGEPPITVLTLGGDDGELPPVRPDPDRRPDLPRRARRGDPPGPDPVAADPAWPRRWSTAPITPAGSATARPSATAPSGLPRGRPDRPRPLQAPGRPGRPGLDLTAPEA